MLKKLGKPRLGLLGIVAVVSTMLAACGEDNSNDAKDANATETLAVGLIPIVDVAPIYIGMDKGFFEENGIKIEPKMASGGAAIVPAVISGDNQIGFSNNVSLIIGKTKGLPIDVVAPGVGVSPDTESSKPGVGYCHILAPKDGKVRKPADLANASIAVNTLNNIGDVTIKAAMEKNGIDYSGVKFQEIPFPDMPAAISANRVDAAWICEPFVTKLLEAGARPILNNYSAADPNLDVASYFASTEWMQKNPESLEGFAKGLQKSKKYASDHPEAVRKAITEYTGIDESTAEKIGLPNFPADFNRDSIKFLIQKSSEYGLIKKEISVDDFISSP